MSVLSIQFTRFGAPRRWVRRAALPLVGVVAGTTAGLAVTALRHRAGRPVPRPLEFALEGNTIEFDKGGVRVAPEAVSAAPGADEASEPAAPGADEASQPTAPGADEASEPAAPGADEASEPAAPGADEASQPATLGAEEASEPAAPGANEAPSPPRRSSSGWP